MRAAPLKAGLDMARRAGFAIAPLLEGMDFNAESVQRLKWVSWNDYCTVCERFESQAGSADAAQRIIEESFDQSIPELRAVAAAIISPKALYQIIYEVIDPIFFPPVEFTYRDCGPDHIRIVDRIRPEFRPCLAYHRMSIGGVRGLTHHLDLPSARVEAELGARETTYDVRLPPSRTIGARVARSSRLALDRALGRVFLRHESGGTALDTALGDLAEDDRPAHIEAAARTLALTRRQAQVLAHLVRGLANKEIAHALDCAEVTVELHVTQILRKAGVASRAQLIASLLSAPP
jgi:DNA-binding CsgD family transcriptional regulator